ncbi:MAG: TIGR03546 family protein [Treponema sp.]|nr:TIGR03546 family protein [Treponema sp.]
MLSYIVSFFKFLNSNSKPSQIANSFCIGLILGFMPKNNIFWFILLFFFAFVRINKCGYGIMILLGSLFAFMFDSLFDSIGYAVLTFAPLENFYAFLLDLPLVGFTKFNNTVVCGSFIFGLLCYIPLFFLICFFVKFWRKTLAPAFVNSKFVKAVYKIPLVEKIVKKVSGSK